MQCRQYPLFRTGEDEFLAKKNELRKHLDECSKKLDALQGQETGLLEYTGDRDADGEEMKGDLKDLLTKMNQQRALLKEEPARPQVLYIDKVVDVQPGLLVCVRVTFFAQTLRWRDLVHQPLRHESTTPPSSLVKTRERSTVLVPREAHGLCVESSAPTSGDEGLVTMAVAPSTQSRVTMASGHS